MDVKIVTGDPNVGELERELRHKYKEGWRCVAAYSAGDCNLDHIVILEKG